MSKAAVSVTRHEMIRWLFILLLALTSLGFALEATNAFVGMLSQPAPLVPFGLGTILAGYFFTLNPLPFGDRNKLEQKTLQITRDFFRLLAGNKAVNFFTGEVNFNPEASKRNADCTKPPGRNPGGILDQFYTLGPYFFPIYTVGLLLIRFPFNHQMLWIFDLILGVSFGFHCVSQFNLIRHELAATKKSKGRNQDFSRFGADYSLVFVVLANLITIPSVLIVVHSGFRSMLRYYLDGQDFWVDRLIGA